MTEKDGKHIMDSRKKKGLGIVKKRWLSIFLMLSLALSLAACGSNSWEVRFEPSGGELISGSLLQTVRQGAAAKAPELKRDGYIFDGWSEDFSAVRKNMVVAARWTPEPESSPAPGVYEVRFELCGGELVSGTLMQQVEEGNAAVAPEVKRDNYIFDGWSEDFSAVRKNMVVAACWSAEPEPSPALRIYEVRFELNGGELVSGKLLQQVEEGSDAEAPVVRREGYVFDGWNEKLEQVESNLVAAAQWKRLYSVRFDPCGGEILSGEAEQQVPEGEYPEPPELSRRNYAFSGWDHELEPVDGDSIYTAKWSAVELRAEEVFEAISPAVVEIMANEASGTSYSLGSGFFIDEQGTLVTNYHVIDGAVSGQVSLIDGRSFPVLYVLGYDPSLDIAILKVDITDNPFLLLAEDGVATGEMIFALGSSEGLTSTFSAGNVSSASREIEGVDYIQITAPISHGNSGGPLVNAFGEVVGINTMAYVEGQNLNFAIDIHELDRVDRSLNLSLEEVFAIQYPSGATGGPGAPANDSDNWMYDLADYSEVESNDTFLRADRIINGKKIAGEITNKTDLDWFYFSLDRACDVDFVVAPSYSVDMDYLLCGIIRLDDEGNTEVLDALMPDSYEGLQFMGGTVHFDKPGDYFIVLMVKDEYPYSTPVYYLLAANW